LTQKKLNKIWWINFHPGTGGIMFDPKVEYYMGQTLLVERIHGNSPSKKIENKLK
jgi:hypothetical protein